MVIGSSNLTSNALRGHYEHNVFCYYEKWQISFDSVKNEFELLWQKSTPLTQQWIKSYLKNGCKNTLLKNSPEVEQTQMLLAE